MHVQMTCWIITRSSFSGGSFSTQLRRRRLIGSTNIRVQKNLEILQIHDWSRNVFLYNDSGQIPVFVWSPTLIKDEILYVK